MLKLISCPKLHKPEGLICSVILLTGRRKGGGGGGGRRDKRETEEIIYGWKAWQREVTPTVTLWGDSLNNWVWGKGLSVTCAVLKVKLWENVMLNALYKDRETDHHLQWARLLDKRWGSRSETTVTVSNLSMVLDLFKIIIKIVYGATSMNICVCVSIIFIVVSLRETK